MFECENVKLNGTTLEVDNDIMKFGEEKLILEGNTDSSFAKISADIGDLYTIIGDMGVKASQNFSKIPPWINTITNVKYPK